MKMYLNYENAVARIMKFDFDREGSESGSRTLSTR